MEWKWGRLFCLTLLLLIQTVQLCQCNELREDTGQDTNVRDTHHSSGERLVKSEPEQTPQTEYDGDEDVDYNHKTHGQSGHRKWEQGQSSHPSHSHSHHHHHQTELRVKEDPSLDLMSPKSPPVEIGLEEGEIVKNVREDSNGYDKSTKKNNDNRPNIILIMTDDQDIELGSMEYMPETLKIFRENGVEFRHGFVATPMCCPSRSSILSGLYVHNHNVYTNNDNCSSVQWREKYEKHTFGAHLWSSGYYTSYNGKYLNKYDGSHIPYGWDEWNGLLMNSRFYNYTINSNGKKFRHGNNYQNDYYPDLIANDTIDFLQRMGDFKNSNPHQETRPFLLVSSFPSPHGPEDSAPQYSHLFFNSTPHHTPSYNHAPNLDKQWILRSTDRMTPLLKDFTNLLMTKRLQTLQSVDSAVKSIMDKLTETGLVENTYIFYTSDHGYHVGQFGLVKGKSMPYEFDIRVPFFLHGPSRDVKKGSKILEPVMNIDLAPTFLDLAGVPIPPEMDGRSILPLLKRYGPNSGEYFDQDGNPRAPSPFVWKDVFLIESSGRREPPESGQGVTQSFKKSKKLREEKRKLLLEDSESSRMNALCLLHPHPCLPGQRKYCRKDRDQDRVQMKKCRQADFIEDPYSFNDPLYQVISSNSNGSLGGQPNYKNLKRCRCRFRRGLETQTFLTDSAGDKNLEEIDWEAERKRIDDEISMLKERIDELRSRRRHMRRKLLSGNVPTPTIFTEGTTSTSTSSNRRGKVEEPRNSNRGEGKEFSIDDFEGDVDTDPEESLSTKSTPTQHSYGHDRERNQDEDQEEEEDEEEGEEEEDEDEDDSEDELEEHYDSEFPANGPTQLTPNQEDHKSTILPQVPNIVQLQTAQTTANVPTSSSSPTVADPAEIDNDDSELIAKISNSNPELPGPGPEFGGEVDPIAPVTPHNHNHNHKHRDRNKNKKNRHKQRQHQHQHQPQSFHGGGRGGSRTSIVSDIIPVPDGDEYEELCDCYNDPRWMRQREREDRKRKKLLSKIRKKQKYMKRIDDPEVRKLAETCGTEEKMNCFWHDSDHWKTAPFWTSGSFCFCMNSNNNTYSCLRSVNATHNYLYCQFVTGFKMYFDLTQDPYQLKNAIGTLPTAQEDWMLVQLIRLKKCKGRAQCWAESEDNEDGIQSSIWEQIFGRWPRKKKRGNRRKQV